VQWWLTAPISLSALMGWPGEEEGAGRAGGFNICLGVMDETSHLRHKQLRGNGENTACACPGRDFNGELVWLLGGRTPILTQPSAHLAITPSSAL
jgi:hypothetical protein